MKQISRRQLLIRLAAATGALTVQQILSGCTPQNTQSPANPTAIPPTTAATNTSVPQPTAPQTTSAVTTAPSSTARPAPSATAQPSATPGVRDLVVIRNGEPEAMARKAIELMGGMGKFIKPNAKVIIKPNICVAYHTYEYAATTNPWLVGTLVKMCFEAGAASVKVMDQPFGGTAKEAYVKSGIEAQVKAAGGEMVQMVGYKYVPTMIPKGKDLKNTSIYDDILKADAIINVPVAKTHGVATLTLSMKNLMGVIDDRVGLHRNIGQRLADLSMVIKPVLNIVDGIRILTANGPTGGNLADVKKLNTIVASMDIVAADAYAASWFGLKPEDLPYVKAGAASGIGKSDLKSLKIEEVNLGA